VGTSLTNGHTISQIYEQHLSRFRNRPALLWEIGVGEGGSLQLWKRYLGPSVQLVGLDILDKLSIGEDQIAVRVGDQSDTTFLQSVISEFGRPDAVIDDGSHVMEDVVSTFRYLYPHIAPGGVYTVEDILTSYWVEYRGGLRKPESFIEVATDHSDDLNADHDVGSPSAHRLHQIHALETLPTTASSSLNQVDTCVNRP
jgi:hypothetical protein